MANRNPKRKRGISVGSFPSLRTGQSITVAILQWLDSESQATTVIDEPILTLRITLAAARPIQENTGVTRSQTC